jgi:hypothetical protein
MAEIVDSRGEPALPPVPMDKLGSLYVYLPLYDGKAVIDDRLLRLRLDELVDAVDCDVNLKVDSPRRHGVIKP